VTTVVESVAQRDTMHGLPTLHAYQPWAVHDAPLQPKCTSAPLAAWLTIGIGLQVVSQADTG
jgi:hypothetical protein